MDNMDHIPKDLEVEFYNEKTGEPILDTDGSPLLVYLDEELTALLIKAFFRQAFNGWFRDFLILSLENMIRKAEQDSTD